MKISKDDYKKLDKLNKRIDAMNKLGVKSFAMEQAQDMLLEFYQREGFDIGKMTDIKFKKRVATMSEEQFDEMMQIADMFEGSIGSKVSDYFPSDKRQKSVNKSFETVKNKYPNQVQTFQDYIDMIDRLNNTDAGITEYYDSDEIAQIYDNGYSMGLDDRQIEDIMRRQAQESTLAHDKRYTATINKIKEEFGGTTQATKKSKKKAFDIKGIRIKASKRE